VGLPVYKGADFIGKCLDCLQRQTFGDFEAIISVDGGDAETAAACRPFLVDPRFRMVVHPERLDWAGNFNWLLQQDLKEFFCYRQHDDTTAPQFFEVLLQAADKDLNAAAIYCDCQYSGGRNDIDIAPSIVGEPRERLFQYLIRVPSSAAPVRGLIRSAAIRQAGLVRSDEFRAPLEVIVWLAKLARCGNFRRFAKPLYYRLDHPHSFSNEYFNSPTDQKLAAWTTLFTGLLEAAIPFCRTPEERLFFQQIVVDRVVVCPIGNPSSSSNLMADCLKRLIYEGNAHLLGVAELPAIFNEAQQRLDEIKLSQKSRLGSITYRIRQRSQMARVIYPRSRMRRLVYQIQHLLEILRNKMSRLLLLPG
jgi:glycosyltransferase involved in cell wall biosynthesis